MKNIQYIENSIPRKVKFFILEPKLLDLGNGNENLAEVYPITVSQVKSKSKKKIRDKQIRSISVTNLITSLTIRNFELSSPKVIFCIENDLRFYSTEIDVNTYMDIIMNCNLNKGFTKNKFLWVREPNTRELALTRFGSDRYRKCIDIHNTKIKEFESKNKLVIVDRSIQFKINRKYKFNNKTYIYLGRFFSRKADVSTKVKYNSNFQLESIFKINSLNDPCEYHCFYELNLVCRRVSKFRSEHLKKERNLLQYRNYFFVKTSDLAKQKEFKLASGHFKSESDLLLDIVNTMDSASVVNFPLLANLSNSEDSALNPYFKNKEVAKSYLHGNMP